MSEEPKIPHQRTHRRLNDRLSNLESGIVLAGEDVIRLAQRLHRLETTFIQLTETTSHLLGDRQEHPPAQQDPALTAKLLDLQLQIDDLATKVNPADGLVAAEAARAVADLQKATIPRMAETLAQQARALDTVGTTLNAHNEALTNINANLSAHVGDNHAHGIPKPPKSSLDT